MPSFGVAVSWMVLAPLAYVTNIVAIAVIMHFRQLYHSADVAFVSLLVTMATSVFLVVPIPAIMELADVGWGHDFCTFYSWLALTLRSSHLIVLLVANMYWLVSMRNTRQGHLFVSSMPMKIAVLISWFVAIIVGILPASGGTRLFEYYDDGECRFLPYDISVGFGLLFIVVCLTSLFMGLIGSVDAMCLFKAMKRVAETKYKAGRFHIPEVEGKARNGSRINDKYNELTVAMELCRLGILVTMVSACVNELPYMIIQFLLMFDVSNSNTLEDVTQWLLLVEALVVPHLLWLFSKRYRHGLLYFFKVVLLRKASVRERDVSACPVQAHRLRAKEQHERVEMNGINVPQANGGHSLSGTEGNSIGTRRPSGNRVTPVGPVISLGEGHTSSSTDGVITTDLDDGMAVLSELTEDQINGISAEHEQQLKNSSNTNRRNMINGGVNPEDYIIKNAAARSSTATLPRVAFVKNGTGPPDEGFHSGRISSTSSSSSPCRSLLGTPQRQTSDVTRSASTSSRREWKERMLKKHLPAVFTSTSLEDKKEVEEGIATEKASAVSTATNVDQIQPPSTQVETLQKSEQQTEEKELYDLQGAEEENHNRPTLKKRGLSSDDRHCIPNDYHHTFLGDPTPRRHSLQTQGTMESDGLSNTYDADDIGHILDDSTSDTTRGMSVREGHVSAFRTIKEPKVVILEDTDIITKNNAHGNSVRDTFIRNSQTHGKEDDEMVDNLVHEITPVLNSQHDHPSSIISDSQSVNKRPMPIVRRTKYRDYMRNASLKVSSVDEEGGEITKHIDGKREDNSISNSPAYGTSSECPPKENNDIVLVDLDAGHDLAESDAKNKSLIACIPEGETGDYQQTLTQQHTDSNSHDSVDICVVDENKQRLVDPVLVSQDYNQLETVSGNELLHLKLRAMRSATAVSFDEDDDDGGNTSEEGGVTNDAFEHDDIPKSTTTVLYSLGRSHSRESSAFSEVEKNNSEFSSVNERYVYGSENDTNGNKDKNDELGGDKKEQSLETQPSQDSTTVTPCGVALERVDSQERGSNLHSNSPERKDLLSKKYPMNPFFRESFETLSQTPEYKRRISSLDNPFTTQESTDSQQSQSSTSFPVETLHNEDNVIHVTSSARRPPLVVKSSSTSSIVDRLKNKPPIPTKPKIKPLVPVKKPLRLKNGDLVRTSSVDDDHSSSVKDFIGSDRFNRLRTSSEDELETFFIKRDGSGFHEDPSIPVEDPSTKSMPIMDATSSPDVTSPSVNGTEGGTEVAETASTSNDHSVVIEPYGHRRPPWLDDMEGLGSSQRSVILPERETLDSESDTDAKVGITSPDIVYSVHNFKPCEVVEYHLDSMNFDDSNISDGHSNGYLTSEPSAQERMKGPTHTSLFHNTVNDNSGYNSNSSSGSTNSNTITPVSSEERPTIQFFQFDDDIEKGFEDALSMEYVTQSNAFSGFGLCFESIKEEPEDSMSESASSFDGLNESNASNMFKTQAIISRPSSRASIASSSNLEIAPSSQSFADFNQGNAVLNGFPHTDTTFSSFETGERTSADGREEIAAITNGNGYHPPAGNLSNNATPPASDVRFGFSLNDSNEFWKDFQESHGDFKEAQTSSPRYTPVDGFDLTDDVFLQTAATLNGKVETSSENPGRTKSPWLEVETARSTAVDLDMSFESDFSHKNGEGELDDDGCKGRQVVGDATPDILKSSLLSHSNKDRSGADHRRPGNDSSVEPVYF